MVVEGTSMSYKAVITRIKVAPHPNADRIAVGDCFGNKVIVSKDTKTGDLGIFFPVEGQLSNEFCQFHDLIARYDTETKKKIGGGFFDKNRRVRAQNFRGVKSEGFWMPIERLYEYFGIDDLYEGMVFDNKGPDDYSGFTTGDGTWHPLCRKYETPATIRAKNNKARQAVESRVINFPRHLDTEQLRYEWDNIPVGSRLDISEKVHGTSHRVAYTKVRQDITWWQRIVNRGFNNAFPEYIWQTVHGTRNTFVDSTSKGYYGSEAWRIDTIDGIDLNKGEVVYGELVGYTPNGPIMNTQTTLPELRKQYPERMVYSYGCEPGEARFLIYRIVQYNNNEAYELSWDQVVDRAKEMGFDTVPDHTKFILTEENRASLREFIEDTTFGPSYLDSRHIREGVVVRVTTPDGSVYFLKNKSFEFGRMEGYIKDSAEYVDREEIA
jgi:hypothetical protein